MHTMSNARAADGLLTRSALFAWAVFEVAAAFAACALVQLLSWQQRSRERRALAGLDDRLLRDIGVSRADADHELSKPFWQI